MVVASPSWLMSLQLVARLKSPRLISSNTPSLNGCGVVGRLKDSSPLGLATIGWAVLGLEASRGLIFSFLISIFTGSGGRAGWKSMLSSSLGTKTTSNPATKIKMAWSNMPRISGEKFLFLFLRAIAYSAVKSRRSDWRVSRARSIRLSFPGGAVSRISTFPRAG